MKKVFVSLLLLVVAFGAFGVGTVFAQGQQPPVRTGMGIMHEYMVAALAEKLNLSDEEVDRRLLDGETMYEIALAEGVAEANLPEFLSEVRVLAFETAVADGVISQVWADRMSRRMFGSSRNGSGYGICAMDGIHLQDGTGLQYGQGMGGRGMHGWWQQDRP